MSDADQNDSTLEYTDDQLDALQWVSLEYYLRETNWVNGLVADKTMKGSPASITAVGMALATAPVLVERGLLRARGHGATGAQEAPLLPQ